MKQTYEVDKGDCKVIVENGKEVGRNNRILETKEDPHSESLLYWRVNITLWQILPKAVFHFRINRCQFFVMYMYVEMV